MAIRFNIKLDPCVPKSNFLQLCNCPKKEEEVTPEPIIYHNSEITGIFTKECDPGYHGTDVTVTVPAGAFVSYISQADADAKAQAELDRIGPELAQEQGECLINPVPCGGNQQYDGGPSFPTVLNMILGTGLGTLRLFYEAYNVPDKIILKVNGTEVANSGYRGSYTTMQPLLDSTLASLGLPPEPIIGHHAGQLYYDKTVQENQVLTIEVYAPLPGTAWRLTSWCPQEQMLPYSFPVRGIVTSGTVGNSYRVAISQEGNVLKDEIIPQNNHIINVNLKPNIPIEVKVTNVSANPLKFRVLFGTWSFEDRNPNCDPPELIIDPGEFKTYQVSPDFFGVCVASLLP